LNQAEINTEASYQERIKEIERKRKAAKSADLDAGSLRDKEDSMEALAKQKIAKAKSRVVRGKQRLARAQARKTADDSGEFGLVVNIYTKRQQLRENRLSKLQDEMRIAKESEQVAQQDSDAAHGKELAVDTANKEKQESRRVVSKLSAKIEKEKDHIHKDQERLTKYRGLPSDHGDDHGDEHHTDHHAKDHTEENLEAVQQELAALDDTGSGSGSGTLGFDTSHFMTKDMKAAAKVVSALSNSLDQENIKDVKMLTRSVEHRMFQEKLNQWKMPKQYRSEIQDVDNLIAKAHSSEAMAASTQALISAAITKPKEATFPGWRAREQAATQIAATKKLNKSLIAHDDLHKTNATNATNSSFPNAMLVGAKRSAPNKRKTDSIEDVLTMVEDITHNAKEQASEDAKKFGVSVSNKTRPVS